MASNKQRKKLRSRVYRGTMFSGDFYSLKLLKSPFAMPPIHPRRPSPQPRGAGTAAAPSPPASSARACQNPWAAAPRSLPPARGRPAAARAAPSPPISRTCSHTGDASVGLKRLWRSAGSQGARLSARVVSLRPAPEITASRQEFSKQLYSEATGKSSYLKGEYEVR